MAGKMDMMYPGRPRLHGYIEYLVSISDVSAGYKFAADAETLEIIPIVSILACDRFGF
jgi:hypothetical protein